MISTSEHPISIMVVDDDEQLRLMLAGLLDDLGYDVVAALPDAQSAIDWCGSHDVDLAILDYRMPLMNGSDAARILSPRVPCILLSAYDDRSLKEAAIESGASSYLVKGCTAAEMRAAIEAAVA